MKSAHVLLTAGLAALLGPGQFARGAEPAGGALGVESRGETSLLEGGKERPVASLSTLHPGARLRIGPGAQLQLVYPHPGRLESWQGKAIIQVGEGESVFLAYQSLPKAGSLPDDQAQALSVALSFPGNAVPRPGQARGLARTKQQAWERYTKMRREAADKDILPELVLLGELAVLKAHGAMPQPLDEILARQGQDPGVQAWVGRFRAEVDARIKAGR